MTLTPAQQRMLAERNARIAALTAEVEDLKAKLRDEREVVEHAQWVANECDKRACREKSHRQRIEDERNDWKRKAENNEAALLDNIAAVGRRTVERDAALTKLEAVRAEWIEGIGSIDDNPWRRRMAELLDDSLLDDEQEKTDG